jgi:hypothetical protein
MRNSSSPFLYVMGMLEKAISAQLVYSLNFISTGVVTGLPASSTKALGGTCILVRLLGTAIVCALCGSIVKDWKGTNNSSGIGCTAVARGACCAVAVVLSDMGEVGGVSLQDAMNSAMSAAHRVNFVSIIKKVFWFLMVGKGKT